MSKKSEVHPSSDGTLRFPLDQLIRQNGYRIVRRPPKGKGEIIWEKWDGERWTVFTQAQVVSLLDQDKVEDSIYLEALYFEGFDE